jgi:hypothetical protein
MLFALSDADAEFDLPTSIDGVEFDSAWIDRASLEVEGRQIPIIGLQALIDNITSVQPSEGHCRREDA